MGVKTVWNTNAGISTLPYTPWSGDPITGAISSLSGRYQKFDVSPRSTTSYSSTVVASAISVMLLHVFLCDIISSVADPHWFQCGGQCGSGSRGLLTKNQKNLQPKFFFYIKNCNLLIPGPTSKLQDRAFSPQKLTSSLQTFLLVLHWSGSSSVDSGPDPHWQWDLAT